jgi:hypothetical protein
MPACAHCTQESLWKVCGVLGQGCPGQPGEAEGIQEAAASFPVARYRL